MTDWPTLIPLIEQQLRDGRTLSAIGRDLGVDHTTVGYHVRRHGTASAAEIAAERQAERAARLAALWQSGMPAAEIGERMGMTAAQVANWACENRERFGLDYRYEQGKGGPAPAPVTRHKAAACAPAPAPAPAPQAAAPRPVSRIAAAIANWRARGASDARIARELRLQASIATEYGLAVMDDTADPFGMDPRRRRAA